MVSSLDSHDFARRVSRIQSQDLLTCELNSDFLRSRCTVETRLFLPRSSFRNAAGKDFPVRLKVTVDYHFPCSGHPMNVGVASEQERARFEFNETQLSLEGYGPFSVLDFAPGTDGTTFLASVSPECKLEVKSVSWDLAPVTLLQLKDWLESAKVAGSIAQSTKNVKQTVASLEAVIDALDIEGVQSVLEALLGEAINLRDLSQGVVDKDALTDVIDEINILLALNPAAQDAEEVRQKASDIFASLSNTIDVVIAGARSIGTDSLHDARKMLNYAAESTQQTYKILIDEAAERL